VEELSDIDLRWWWFESWKYMAATLNCKVATAYTWYEVF